MSIASQLNQAWLSKGPLACMLWPVSLLMHGLVSIRRALYRRGWLAADKLPVPVLVIGNRVVGGAGKTPTTIAVLQHLQALGWHPGVLSRGYGAAPPAANAGPNHHQGALLIDAHTGPTLSATVTGDEPLLIWRRTGAPVMVGRDRVASARALLQAHPHINLLVCDDGLQHLRLQRDIEIVVFDERGAGNGWLLPAGPLREPIDAPSPPQVRGAAIVLYNAKQPSTRLHGHLARRVMAPLRPLHAWWQGDAATTQSATLSPAALPHADQGQADASVWALAGIAQPQRFFEALRAQGFQVHGLALEDHADFSTLPWPAQVKHLIVTEKDAVKLRPERIAIERPGTQVWVSALDLHPEDSFWTAVDAALAPLAIKHPTGARHGHP